VIGVGVGAGVEVDDTPNMVPVTCARVGLLVALRVAERHGGVPVVTTGVGVTACQAPAPLFAVGLNHSRPLPPPRLQSLIVAVVNALPAERATSKYAPDEVKGVAITGSDPYWATVSPPTPVALAVVPALTAEAVPVEIEESPLAELIDAVGAAGATGGGGLPLLTATLVSPKLADVKPVEEAMTVKAAAVLLAVNAVARATPLLPERTVVVSVPLANEPLAPLDGAVKMTEVAVLTGLPDASSTVALNGVVNAVPTVALWLPPAVTNSWWAAPATLVSVKLAGVRLPDAAVTW